MNDDTKDKTTDTVVEFDAHLSDEERSIIEVRRPKTEEERKEADNWFLKKLKHLTAAHRNRPRPVPSIEEQVEIDVREAEMEEQRRWYKSLGRTHRSIIDQLGAAEHVVANHRANPLLPDGRDDPAVFTQANWEQIVVDFGEEALLSLARNLHPAWFSFPESFWRGTDTSRVAVFRTEVGGEFAKLARRSHLREVK